MSLTWRAYQHPDDWEELIALLLASQAAGLADSEFRSIELRALFLRADFDTPQFTRVADDERGRMLAFGVLFRGQVLAMLLHPQVELSAARELINWAGATVDPQTALQVVCRDDHSALCHLLETSGFRVAGHELRMVRDLTQPVPPWHLPDGFRIRSLAGEQELPAWVDLYNHAFADTEVPGPTTIKRWAPQLDGPDYDPALNLVVVDRANALAAMCHCSIALTEAKHVRPREGRTDPIATAPQYRRIGLARAAILAGLHLLRERGMEIATLTTADDNHPAHRLYESLGYVHAYSARWHEQTRD